MCSALRGCGQIKALGLAPGGVEKLPSGCLQLPPDGENRDLIVTVLLLTSLPLPRRLGLCIVSI